MRRSLLAIAALALALACGDGVEPAGQPHGPPIATGRTCNAPFSTSVACYDADESETFWTDEPRVHCMWPCARYEGKVAKTTLVFALGPDGCFADRDPRSASPAKGGGLGVALQQHG